MDAARPKSKPRIWYYYVVTLVAPKYCVHLLVQVCTTYYVQVSGFVFHFFPLFFTSRPIFIKHQQENPLIALDLSDFENPLRLHFLAALPIARLMLPHFPPTVIASLPEMFNALAAVIASWFAARNVKSHPFSLRTRMISDNCAALVLDWLSWPSVKRVTKISTLLPTALPAASSLSATAMPYGQDGLGFRFRSTEVCIQIGYLFVNTKKFPRKTLRLFPQHKT